MKVKLEPGENISFEDFRAQILQDYKIAVTSRECSLLGRREVLTGKAKFGTQRRPEIRRCIDE